MISFSLTLHFIKMVNKSWENIKKSASEKKKKERKSKTKLIEFINVVMFFFSILKFSVELIVFLFVLCVLSVFFIKIEAKTIPQKGDKSEIKKSILRFIST